MRRRGSLVAVCCLVIGGLGAGLSGPARAAPRQPEAGPARAGVATPNASQVSAGCQLPDPSRELGPEPQLPPNPVKQVVKPAGGVWSFAVAHGSLYLLNGTGLSVYSLGGALRRHVELPASIVAATSNGQPVTSDGISQPVVAPNGDVFISSYYGQSVVEVTASGRVSATGDSHGQNPTNIFALRSATGSWELGVSLVQNPHRSRVYRLDGRPAGTVPLWASEASFLSEEANGDVLDATGTGMVNTWNPTATRRVGSFGDNQIHGNGVHTGGAYEFYLPGEADGGRDDIYALNGPSTLTVTTPDGELAGTTTFNNTLEATGDLATTGTNLYLQTGPPFDDPAAGISKVSMATVQRYLRLPEAPANVLGWGAGLNTSADGNYFPHGHEPSVFADFNAWWAARASQLELSYQVWDDAALTDGRAPVRQTIQLPTHAAALAHVALRIPTGDRGPGPYEVEAELYDTASSPARQLGATCLPYTVGAAGDRLDLGQLPSGIGTGGPSDVRGVALNAELGLDGLRSSQTIDWSSILPACNASAPTAATCGPGALRLGQAPRTPFQAAYLATKDHVRYWIQVSGGDPVSLALVNDGWWQADVQALVAHYSHVPAGCQHCAPVTAWEPWNEPNNTGWSDPAAYATKVLAPFYRAVKSARPADTVIGGSTLEVDLSWWKGFVAAGGLRDLNVAAVHPYPGSNDSWEEDGIPGQLKQLESLLGPVPLWLTEVGWWSNGDYDFLAQANNVARAMIWQRALHIPVWNYFIDEGSFSPSGSFSLIEAANGGSGDDYVKPSALATMTAAAQLAGRRSFGVHNPGIPQTYAARFGASPTDHQALVAVWSDGLAVTASLAGSAPGGGSVPVTMTSQYGSSRTVQLKPGTHYALGLSDQVVYLAYPAADDLHVGPAERYGSDLALAANGATATASSGDAKALLVNPTDATGYGQGWTSSPSDHHPVITVHLRRAAPLNRVLVDTQSLGSVASGVRDYTISVQTTSKRWRRVATVAGQFRNHVEQVAFDPVRATAVRLTVTMVNLGAYYGGGVPSFCTQQSCSAVAFLHAIEVYDGSASPATAKGANLARLQGGVK